MHFAFTSGEFFLYMFFNVLLNFFYESDFHRFAFQFRDSHFHLFFSVRSFSEGPHPDRNAPEMSLR